MTTGFIHPYIHMQNVTTIDAQQYIIAMYIANISDLLVFLFSNLLVYCLQNCFNEIYMSIYSCKLVI